MSLSKRLDEARQAFSQRDKQAAARAHDPQRIAQAAEEKHGGAASQYIGDFVYGGLDGIITTFAVVSGVAGANLDTSIIVILGLANLLADGFSMATGAYLSSKSEKELYDKERERELWEVQHFPAGEKSELYEIYRQRGYLEEDASALVEIQSKDTDRWVDAMMIDELGLLKDDRHPLLSGLATLVAFIVAGVVPLAIYLLDTAVPISAEVAYPIALVLSGLALFGLGAAKVLITHRSTFKSGLEMLLVGGLAAGVAYAIGVLLEGLSG